MEDLGVYAFAIGYTAGAWAQLAVVYYAARSGLLQPGICRTCGIHWREILSEAGVLSWCTPRAWG